MTEIPICRTRRPVSAAARFVIVALTSMGLCIGQAFAAEAAGPTHTVVAGETLTSIANAFLIDGATPANIAHLARLNRIADPNRIAPARQLLLPPDRLRMSAREATVHDAYGPATVDGRPAAKGDRTLEGQTLAAGPGGGVQLRLPDGTLLWIRDGARLKIDILRTAPGLEYDDTQLSLEAGRIEALIAKLRGRSRFEVRSPVARLGVRGTQLRSGYDAGERRAVIEVLEGEVGANASDAVAAARPVAVGAGMGVVADAVRGMGQPKALPPAPALTGLPALFERPLVTFNIAGAAGAAGMSAQVRNPSTQHVVAAANVTGRALRFADLPDGDYLLVVRARDADGLEGTESVHPFRLAARPEPPFGSMPRNRQTARSERVEFAWSAAANARSYRLQVAAGRDFSAPVLNEVIEGSAFATDRLTPGEYAWRLASIDATGRQGPFGDPLQFTLRPMPGAPAEPAVRDGVAQFSWPGEPGQKFELQVARTADFSAIERTVVLDEPRAELTGLTPGPWHMRVRATDPDGYVGPYTGSQRFVVPEPPPPPPPPAPLWPFVIPLLLFLL